MAASKEKLELIFNLLQDHAYEELHEHYKEIEPTDFEELSTLIEYCYFLVKGADLDGDYVTNFLLSATQSHYDIPLLRLAYNYFFKQEDYETSYEFLVQIQRIDPLDINVYKELINYALKILDEKTLAFDWFKEMNEKCEEPVFLNHRDAQPYVELALFFVKHFPDYSPKLFRSYLEEKQVFAKEFLEIQEQAPYKILVDGSNIAYENSIDKQPKVLNLILIYKFLEKVKQKHPVVSFLILVDASLLHHIDDHHTLDKLISQNKVRQVPAGTSADDFLLEFFKLHPKQTFILSNDQFKDYDENIKKDLYKNRFPLMILFDEVIVPNFPFSPTADPKPSYKQTFAHKDEHAAQSQTSPPPFSLEQSQLKSVRLQEKYDIDAMDLIEKIWLNRIALVYKELTVFGYNTSYGMISQWIMKRFDGWATDYEEFPKFKEFIGYFREKYAFQTVEHPKNNFLLKIDKEDLQDFMNLIPRAKEKYFYKLLEIIVEERKIELLDLDLKPIERVWFIWLLELGLKLYKMDTVFSWVTIVQLIGRNHPEDPRSIEKITQLEDMIPIFYEKSLLRPYAYGNKTFYSVHLLDFPFFSYSLRFHPHEFIQRAQVYSDPLTRLLAKEEHEEELLNSSDTPQSEDIEDSLYLLDEGSSFTPQGREDIPYEEEKPLLLSIDENLDDRCLEFEHERPVELEGYSMEEMKWISRIFNLAEMTTGNKKECFLSNLAAPLRKFYGILPWKSDLPEYNELSDLIQHFAEKAGFHFRATEDLDYVFYLSRGFKVLIQKIADYYPFVFCPETVSSGALIDFDFEGSTLQELFELSFDELVWLKIIQEVNETVKRARKIPKWSYVEKELREKEEMWNKDFNSVIDVMNLLKKFEKLEITRYNKIGGDYILIVKFRFDPLGRLIVNE